jgi:hypothetical protein
MTAVIAGNSTADVAGKTTLAHPCQITGCLSDVRPLSIQSNLHAAPDPKDLCADTEFPGTAAARDG